MKKKNFYLLKKSKANFLINTNLHQGILLQMTQNVFQQNLALQIPYQTI